MRKSRACLSANVSCDEYMRDEREHLFGPDFIEREEAVPLSTQKPNFDPILTQLDDFSELELFINHRHIQDSFENDAESAEHPFYDESVDDLKLLGKRFRHWSR